MDPRIIVATHKRYRMPEDAVYLPVHAGAALSASSSAAAASASCLPPLGEGGAKRRMRAAAEQPWEGGAKRRMRAAAEQPWEGGAERRMRAPSAVTSELGYTPDDTGDNISARNGSYCELTALYWAWKNLPADALGLCHYRRYFQEPGKKQILTGDTLRQLLEETPVILPRKRNYFIETGESQFVHAHGAESLEILREALQDTAPAYREAFDGTMGRTDGHRFNMMIMRREQMDAYCGWLFGILFETEKRMENRMGAVPSRMMGYLAERLLDAWIGTEEIPYRELPVFHTEKTNWLKKGGTFLLRKVRG